MPLRDLTTTEQTIQTQTNVQHYLQIKTREIGNTSNHANNKESNTL